MNKIINFKEHEKPKTKQPATAYAWHVNPLGEWVCTEVEPPSAQVIGLLPAYVARKIASGSISKQIRDFDYLLFSEAYPDGKILTWKQWLAQVRSFGETDQACAVSVQLPIDREFFLHSAR